MSKKRKFKSEKEEQEFWASHDSTDYVDWESGRRTALPKLRPSVKTISLRFPESLLEELKILAHKRDVPYQSLIKVFLAERIRNEFKEDAAWSRQFARPGRGGGGRR